MIQNAVKNLLLSSMPAQTFEVFSKGGEIVPLIKRANICMPDSPMRHCWFPLAGMVSIIAMDADGNEAEIGMIGRDGMVNPEVALGCKHSVSRGMVQVEGSALKVSRELFEAELKASPVFNAQVLAYVQRQMVQLGEAALAYSRYTIEKRLARWLLIAADLTGSDELPLTHESLSIMLGIRRAGVTISLNKLMEFGGVSLKRGIIVISDRQSLQQVAGASYQQIINASGKADGIPTPTSATVSRLIFDRDW